MCVCVYVCMCVEGLQALHIQKSTHTFLNLYIKCNYYFGQVCVQMYGTLVLSIYICTFARMRICTYTHIELTIEEEMYIYIYIYICICILYLGFE